MSYKTGIIEAIEERKERSGSSSIAIKKYMQTKLQMNKTWKNGVFLLALKNGVASGDFVQNKNSYKLSSEFKKEKATKLKKVLATKKKVSSAALKHKSTNKDAAKKSLMKKVASKRKVATKKKTFQKKKSAPKKKTVVNKKSLKSKQ